MCRAWIVGEKVEGWTAETTANGERLNRRWSNSPVSEAAELLSQTPESWAAINDYLRKDNF